MAEQIIKISDDFLNIRGDFKIGGILNIGTQASLVRRSNGAYVLLDSYALSGAIKAEVDALTEHGEKLEAIINLHPFHTVHVEAAHAMYPNAMLYGTQRHHDKFPELPWQPALTESAEFANAYAADFEFSVPAGVDFISNNENLHFSSVLAYHKASRTLHVDDTLMYIPLPGIVGKVRKPKVSFHLTLAKTLEKRAGACADFRRWATQLAEQWHDAQHLCAAHSATLLDGGATPGSIAKQILEALSRAEKTLRRHEKKYG
ncbi:hypothetical protein [Litorivivens sp.]|uniref:hypothetical protein n=1 Tax=Litorivivens sp. TaxID=2020868 RepID=UPI00356AA46E